MLKAYLLALIKTYQAISRHYPPRCRFYPTCSAYTVEAIEAQGALHGLLQGLSRLLRCHPLCTGGPDPYPYRRTH